jgi:outer membrane receptor protein involved in Fe transport
MIKKIVFILFIALFLLSGTFAQRKGSISGTISDSKTGDNIPFATVSLLSNKQFISLGAVSDQKGVFEIKNIPLETYEIVVSFIGYQTDTLDNIVLSRENPLVNLALKLSPSSVELSGVDVTAMSNTVVNKIDRKTYRAADFETAKGGTAVDVLNKLPSVSVSPDGEVSVRGTTDFMVYLNGKPTQMEPSMLLAQLSGDAIENIDIITVPSAKYDAQGKGGIINITTKTSGLQGLSVSANGLLGGAPWGHKSDPYDGYAMNDNRYGGGLNLLYGKNKLSLFGGINYNYKNVNGLRTGDARVYDTETDSYKHMVADGERPEWYENLTANGGFDYKLSAASQLSGAYFYGQRTEGRSAFYVYNTYFADADKNPVAGVDRNEAWIYNPNTDNRYGIFHSGNIDFKHKFDEKSSLAASLMYEHSSLYRQLDNYNYRFDVANDRPEEIQLHFNQTDDTPLDGYRLSLDYAKEFDNGNTLGIGLQPQLFSIAGGFSYDTLNVLSGSVADYTSLENGIEVTRGIYAGYIDYAGSWGKLKYLAGLRLEYTDQVMNIDNPDYFTIFDRPTKREYLLQQLDWFPTLHATWQLGNTNKLSMAASRRISRPPIKNMAPFLYRRHLEVYEVGDPYLKPEYLNSAELGFEQQVGKQKFTLTGFYRGVDNAVFRVNTIYDNELVLIRSYTNAGNTQALGVELNANLEAGKFAKFFVGGSLYNYHIQGEVFGYKEDNSSTNWSLKGNANFFLTKELKLTADFDIKSATVTSQGRNDMFYMANLALSYAPPKLQNWNFTAKVLDVLDSNIKGLNTRAYNSEGKQIFYQETVYYRTGPIVELSASYAFNRNGNGKDKKTQTSFGNSEF